ncbi:Cytoplasmic polyadenylation element-binding protein 2, partial [Geodia barretti]
SKAYFPPKGYAFLLFREEASVHRLVKSCLSEEGKLYMFVSSLTQSNKKVQIRPWRLSDSDFIMDHTQPIDARKTIFIGGVPRPLKACELADIFNARYGNVCYAGIDCDPDLKYPKGAGRVTFSSRVSFMSAVSCRFLQVTYGDIDKKVTKMCMYSPLVSSLPINYSHAVSTRSFSHVVQWKFSQSETWEAFLLACGSLYLCYLLHAVSLHVTGRQLTNLFVPKEPMLFQPVH